MDSSSSILAAVLFSSTQNDIFCNMKIRHLLAIALFAATLGARAQDRATDPLERMTQCFSSGEFHYKEKDRRPAAASSRVVETQSGPRQVSTVDGYRLMVYRNSSLPLVNLKIERSAEGRFADDRAAITAQMQAIAATSRGSHQISVEASTQNGIEVLALNNTIDSPGVVSFYTLFDAQSGTVATAYVLNQRRDIREYASDADYAILRDRFIAQLGRCMGTR